MIQVQNLVKDYGSVRAVDTINFEVADGEILGFLGPNGAGKSTTLKMITCFLTPTAGNVLVNGLNIHEHSLEIRKLLGYLPEQNPLYLEMTVYDYLEFIAKVRGISAADKKKAINRVINKTGIAEVAHKPIQTLSKGYKQRVGIAQALIHDPKILILDEPTSGLDPNQIIEIRELIKDLGKEKTLIISSHILQEVQAVCSRIIIIKEGAIVADGSTEDLKASMQGKVRLNISFTGELDLVRELPNAIEDIQLINLEPRGKENHALFEFDSCYDFRPQVYNWFKETDLTLLEMHRDYISLEDVFRQLTNDKAPLAGGTK